MALTLSAASTHTTASTVTLSGDTGTLPDPTRLEAMLVQVNVTNATTSHAGDTLAVRLQHSIDDSAWDDVLAISIPSTGGTTQKSIGTALFRPQWSVGSNVAVQAPHAHSTAITVNTAYPTLIGDYLRLSIVASVTSTPFEAAVVAYPYWARR